MGGIRILTEFLEIDQTFQQNQLNEHKSLCIR